MSAPHDQVSVEDAYAAALVEIGRLQQRLILGQALITSLKRDRGVSDGSPDAGRTGHADRGVDTPHHFLD